MGIPGMVDTLWAASVVIGVDASVVHIASGMRKPLLAIYSLVCAVANPWLPPPRSSTLVVYSPVNQATYSAAGLKCLDNYLDRRSWWRALRRSGLGVGDGSVRTCPLPTADSIDRCNTLTADYSSLVGIGDGLVSYLHGLETSVSVHYFSSL